MNYLNMRSLINTYTQYVNKIMEEFKEFSRLYQSQKTVCCQRENIFAGFFDNYKTFELWLMNNIENYPDNEDIFPLPAQYR